MNVIQRIRKFLGLPYIKSGGSGTVTTIPPMASSPSLRILDRIEQKHPYDPIPYKSYDLPRWGTGRVTNLYNEKCTAVGLQSVVRMDPSDFKTIYEFKNVSTDKLIRIRWQDAKQSHEILLEPNESTTVKIGTRLIDIQQYPEVKAFQYGDSSES